MIDINIQTIIESVSLKTGTLLTNFRIYIELVTILVCWLLATISGRKSKPYVSSLLDRLLPYEGVIGQLKKALLDNLTPVYSLLLLWFSLITERHFGLEGNLLNLVASLLTAWVIIHLTSSCIKDAFWYKTIAFTAWVIAALNITGLLHPTIDFLRKVGFSVGDININLFSIIKASVVLLFLLKSVSFFTSFAERRISTMTNLTPSVQVLFTKFLKISLFAMVLIVTVQSMGLNLTAFTVFSGAVGVGVGLGLQKVISNLFSGVILLMDRSLKPGDVIQIDNKYGWVTRLNARHVSIVTRDGTEYLIPNDDLITSQVINWSYSDKNVRLRAPVGISYESDVKKAMALMVEAAKEMDRVLKNPEPVCRLMGFGDSSIDLELRFWINDPAKGINNVRSAIYLNIWDKFGGNNIVIPFPQRDVNLKVNVQDLPDHYNG